MSTSTNQRLRQIGVALASPKFSVVCIALLIVLTFWGTVYQVHEGLHAAKVRYFDSYWCTIGYIPFPGGQLVMGAFTLNLFCYLVRILLNGQSSLSILCTHAGILMLMVGGAITNWFGDEAHLTLAEGETANVAASYQDWELALWRTDMGVRDVRAQDTAGLRAGDVVEFPEAGLTIGVETYYPHARAFLDAVPNPPESTRKITRLESAPLEKEPERNTAGAILNLSWPGGTSRRVLLFAEDAVEDLVIGNQSYTLALRHRRYPLPVRVTLKDFRRDMHPGTEMARSYESEIGVFSPKGERDVVVSMNRPFREGGFTFYQASFSEGGNGQTSTFAVTRNAGRLLPYIATSVVFIGMVIHFGVMLVQRARRTRAA